MLLRKEKLCRQITTCWSSGWKRKRCLSEVRMLIMLHLHLYRLVPGYLQEHLHLFIHPMSSYSILQCIHLQCTHLQCTHLRCFHQALSIHSSFNRLEICNIQMTLLCVPTRTHQHLRHQNLQPCCLGGGF